MNCGARNDAAQCTHQYVCEEILNDYAPACSDMPICVLDNDCVASLQASDEVFTAWIAQQRTSFHASPTIQAVSYYVWWFIPLLFITIALYLLFFTHRKRIERS